MHEQDKAILQGLVSVAWSDGTFEAREKELLDALIESFGATDDEAKELKEYAADKKDLGDIPLTELSFGDRRTLMSYAVTLSWIDGIQADAELAFLSELCEHLKIDKGEYGEINSVATQRAKDMLAADAAG